jgi:catalase (peroxidase I)
MSAAAADPYSCSISQGHQQENRAAHNRTAQAAKQILDRVLPSPVSYADLIAIGGAAAVYATNGPLINVGYGRPDVDGPDHFIGVGSNTNQQRDYPIQEIINEWSECPFSTLPLRWP